jgi:hypothetical protein
MAMHPTRPGILEAKRDPDWVACVEFLGSAHTPRQVIVIG